MIQYSPSITLRAAYFKKLIISIFHTFCLWVWVFGISLLSHLTAYCCKPVFLNNTLFSISDLIKRENSVSQEEKVAYFFFIIRVPIVLLIKRLWLEKKTAFVLPTIILTLMRIFPLVNTRHNYKT